MRCLSLWSLVCLFIVGCGSPNNLSEIKFESAHSVLRVANIEDAQILVRSGITLEEIESEITSQLKYSTGLLNGENSVADMQDLKIDIHTYEEKENKLRLVSYDAELKISLAKKYKEAESLNFYLPQRGDEAFLRFFHSRLGGMCVQRNPGHVVTPDDFWYYFRPQNCQVNNFLSSDMFKMKVSLTPSSEKSNNKYPEYDRIWEDSELNVVFVFGRNHVGYNRYDVGFHAFVQAYNQLLATYGQPTSVSPRFRPQQFGMGVDDVQLAFTTKKGVMNVKMILMNDLSLVGEQFWKSYSEATKKADFIAYNGHSGYGKNIKTLLGKGKFNAGQYKVFLLNGCISYSYVGKKMFDIHSKINNGEDGSKYVDIISNAMPAYFHHNALSSLHVLRSLYDQSKNYKEILTGFPEVQRANVIGEEDNLWVPEQ